MDEKRFPRILKGLYQLVDELEAMFPGRHFTPDGHMVGSIGEALAAYFYGLDLLPPSSKGRDAMCGEKIVEVKATQGNSVSFRCAPRHLIVLRIARDGSFSEIYNGSGDRVWALVDGKPMPTNGQHQIRLSALRRLMEKVPSTERLPRIRAGRT